MSTRVTRDFIERYTVVEKTTGRRVVCGDDESREAVNRAMAALGLSLFKGAIFDAAEIHGNLQFSAIFESAILERGESAE